MTRNGSKALRCAAGGMAVGSAAMTPAQIGLVQDSFARLRPIQEATAQLFYLRLLECDPGLQNLFPRDLETPHGAFMAALSAAVDGLNDLDSLRPALRDLALRHVRYGVRHAHYASFGEAMLWTLEIALGDGFNAPLKQAWTAFHRLLFSTMVDAAVRHQARTRSRPSGPVRIVSRDVAKEPV